ncbi:DUF4261 domain-containing protein [Gorillibacterium sp. sgz5001074]|uniref:DUF4261 domain-containing protein n=1 Tax=Gorillibacterium sp. sgz5001074 TaxID=3446695 RepID=UPI003F6656C2
MAVKIENSGMAHSVEDWVSMDSDEISELFDFYVAYARADDFYYSCGMQVFGLPDAIIDVTLSPERARYVLTNFIYFLLTENPELHSGETFSVSASDPNYKLSYTDCYYFDKDELFHNPYGVWVLKGL